MARCDNGGEFTSNSMIKFYNQNGILLQTTCPHTPQQNGSIKRKYRHLLETDQALRFEAKLPTRFWGECILTAAYIIYSLHSKLIEKKTSYEIFWNQSPEYSHMRSFGCRVYFKNMNLKGDKFEEKGKTGVFLGYPTQTKGYKFYDIQVKKITVSRDVLFCEDRSPFKNIKTDDNYEDEDHLKVHSSMFHVDPEPTQAVKPTHDGNQQTHVDDNTLTGDPVQNKSDSTKHSEEEPNTMESDSYDNQGNF